MKTSRRQFIQTTVAGATVATTTQSDAADPYAPADGGLVARWFNKNRQHVLPPWAFTRDLPISPTPVPTKIDSQLNLVAPNGKDAFLDGKAVGEVLHGVAVEWNGTLIGGNKEIKDATGKVVVNAWETMKDRVRPLAKSEYNVIGKPDKELKNWDAHETVRCYKVVMKEKLLRLRLDAAGSAILYSYADMVPGPTFRFRHGVPCVVRFENLLQTETSIHHHGGHTPSHSDGFPSFYVLQNEARDYLYPNILPLRLNADGKAVLDYGEGQSTTWYHDHGLDATAFNVSHGLAGFALWFDDLELELIRKGVLPGLRDISGNDYTLSPGEYQKWNNAWIALNPLSDLRKQWISLMTSAGVSVDKPADLPNDADHNKAVRDIETSAQKNTPGFYGFIENEKVPGVSTPYFNPYDIPIALQDRVVDLSTGQIVYDSDGHNGYIGNTQLLNAEAWPVLRVKRRKYRFRLLDGSNARIYRLRFLDSDTFRLGLNGDGDLEPANIPDATLENNAMDFLRIGKDSWLWAKPRRMKSVMLNMANRADLILEFDEWFKKAEEAGRLQPAPDGKQEAVYYMVNTMPQFDGRGPKGKLAEDAGDPQVFPLPFTLDPANPILAQMRNAGLIPAGFFGGGAQGQVRELNQPIGLMKIIIEDDFGEGADATINEETILRPRHTIKDDEVMAVREFVFERGKGAWMINSRFYDPTISNANPISGIKGQNFRVPDSSDSHFDIVSLSDPGLTKYATALKNPSEPEHTEVLKHIKDPQKVEITERGNDDVLSAELFAGIEEGLRTREPLDQEKPTLEYAEEWILRNGGGGWWHPIHIHLEGHQLVGYEKDFAADGLIDGDGVLGAAAQANMVALPRWGQMVTRFGLDPLIQRAEEGSKAPLQSIRSLLLDPTEALKDQFASNPLLEVLLDVTVEESYRTTPADNPTLVEFMRGAPLVLTELRASGLFLAQLNALAKPLRDEVNDILDALQKLALQWVGEMTGNHDTQALGPNTVARIRMRFRTFSGPFVFHCHNVEHEDMRMMVNFEPTLKLNEDNTFEKPNTHNPDIYPTARTHGQDVTDLKTNPHAIGELPWSSIEKFANHWEEKPVPYTPVQDAGDPLISPRTPKNQ
jgi:FtsP/CotA-like multicopper oxidase with cupredoxin domain